jgi:hypothetical protein
MENKTRPESNRPKKIIEQIPYEKKVKKAETISIDEEEKEVNIKTDEFKDISNINSRVEQGEAGNDIFKEIAEDMDKKEEDDVYDDFERMEENKLDIIKEESIDKKEKERSAIIDVSKRSERNNNDLFDELDVIDIEEEVKVTEPKKPEPSIKSERNFIIEVQEIEEDVVGNIRNSEQKKTEPSVIKSQERTDARDVEQESIQNKEDQINHTHTHTPHLSLHGNDLKSYRRNQTSDSNKGERHSTRKRTAKSKGVSADQEVIENLLSEVPTISFYNNDIESLGKQYSQYLTKINNEQKITFKIQHNVYEYIKGFNPKILIEKTKGEITSMCFLSYDTSYEFALRLVINHFSTVEYNDIESKFSKFIQFILEHFLFDELYIDLHYYNDNGTFTINTYIRDILKKLSFKWSKLEHRQNERYQKVYIKNPKVATSMDVRQIKQFRQMISMENITLIDYDNKQNIMAHSIIEPKHAEKKVNVFPVIYSLTNLGGYGFDVEGGIVDTIRPDIIKVILFL